MDKEELKQYLKDNLTINWVHIGERLYITLELEREIISKIEFAQD